MSKQLRAAAAVGLFVALAGSGCHDDGPTSPLRVAVPTPTVTPIPTFADLSGTWSGTVSSSGRTDEFFCPPHAVALQVTVVQSGPNVTFGFESRFGTCLGRGSVTFRGQLDGSRLSGEVRDDGARCVLNGSLSGTGELTAIRLDGVARGTCNDVNVHVVLAR